ncbi:MAG: glycosyltransferase family 4 protein [Candidatus Binatia bacterium]
MRVAFVVQRYGPSIDGGSEALCREIAERLATETEIEVVTTTAADYLTWRNELPVGLTEENGVRVRRFPVASRRRVRSFGRLSERLYRGPHSVEDEIDWMIRQGPRVPELLGYLKEARGRFDAFVFFTYLYYTTWFGLPLVAERSVLVPTLHDEPPARFEIFRSLFQLPRAFVWNTPEERELARSMFPLRADGEVAGVGIDLPGEGPPAGFRERHRLGEFLLYLGRVDVWKGVPELLDFFTRYRAERAPDLTLVLAGREHMKLPRADGLVSLGYVSEDDKRAALAEASVTVMPSSYESLSLVALESWAAGTPVAATVRSGAVAGQLRRSDGGIAYGSYEEFRAAIDRLRAPEGRELGAAGRRFVERECSWLRVLDVYRRAIRGAASR